MSAPSAAPAPDPVTQRREAAEWFVAIHTEDEPSVETLQAWLRWMDQHEGNRMAFESIAQAWHSTPGSAALSMPGAAELRSDTYDGEQSVEEWLASRTAGAARDEFAAGTAARRSHRARRWTWLAAASLAAVTLGLMTMNHLRGLDRPESDIFTTRNGEQIEITLADGSRVWLGPKSTLQVNFTRQRRGIQLTTGEAFFSVKKDRTRPFVVHSTGGDITAVGTAFNVRAVTDHVTVSVSEGVVTVAPRDQPAVPRAATAVRVESGQQLTFTAQEPLQDLAIESSATPGERARWRDGVLVYRDEPLREVILDVARYSDRQLEIADDAAADLHYTGVVYKGAVDEWASALPESFPVKVVSDGNRAIISAR